MHVAKSNFTEKHHAFVVLFGCEAVVCRFGGHVRKVDSLAKHVTGDGSFGRRNAQALR